ncbi:MAG: sigma-70 family RNA polymerase sigma factor [Planctomycetota bacterium]|nr:sigma-70 family RNA polymerase sigma factor [Planctomycetota bacterium]
MDERTRQATRRWTLAQPVVSAFLASVVRDFRDRDDLLQETALAVIDSYDRYDSSRSFNAWALGIARNQVRLYQRRRQRDRLVFDDNVMVSLATAFAEITSEESHSFEFLQDCLDKLEGRARSLCELRYQDDLKPAIIAARLGMTANSVAKALQRIRDQLRDCIELRRAQQGAI